jgi:hypothetical protein
VFLSVPVSCPTPQLPRSHCLLTSHHCLSRHQTILCFIPFSPVHRSLSPFLSSSFPFLHAHTSSNESCHTRAYRASPIIDRTITLLSHLVGSQHLQFPRMHTFTHSNVHYRFHSPRLVSFALSAYCFHPPMSRRYCFQWNLNRTLSFELRLQSFNRLPPRYRHVVVSID